MEKKKVGGLLVFISLILYIASYFLLYIFLILDGIFITYLWIVGILAIAGISSTLIGGLMAKRDRGSWLLLIGLIMIFGAIFLDVFFFLWTEIFASLSLPIGILIVMGFIIVGIGGLTKDEKGKNSSNIGSEKTKKIARIFGLLILVIGLFLVLIFILLGSVNVETGPLAGRSSPFMVLVWDIFITGIILVFELFLVRLIWQEILKD